MLLRLFRGTGPGVMVLIGLTATGVWTRTFIDPQLPSAFYYDMDLMPLYALLKGVIGNSAIIGALFSYALVLFMSFLLVNFNTTVFFINERTFLPAVIYILFSGLFPHYQLLNPILPASVFLLLAIMRIMEAYRKNGTAFNFFDASLLIGTGSLFYANLIWFSLLVIIGIAILRTGNVKELILAILGLITPFVLSLGIYYVVGKDINLLFSVITYNLFEGAGDFYYSRIEIIGLIIVGISILISIFHLLSVLNIKKIKSRKTFSILLWTFAISLIAFFVLPSASVEIVYIGSIPICYFLTHYFVFSKKRWMPEILFSALFLIIIALQIWYIK